MTLNPKKIRAVLSSFQKNPSRRPPKIAVIGDYCLDKYLYIFPELDEPSVETGLTAYQVRDKRMAAGVGGTITANLCSLGAEVLCVGIYGQDGEGFELTQALNALGADTSCMLSSDEIYTCVYLKPLRRAIVDGETIWQEQNRLDIRNGHPAPPSLIDRVLETFEKRLPDVDAVIVSDQFTFQAGSLLTEKVRNQIAKWAIQFPQIFFLGDSRSHGELFHQIMLKCNASELLDMVHRIGLSPTESCHAVQGASTFSGVVVDTEAIDKEEALIQAGQALALRNGKAVLVTLGEKGALLFEQQRVVRIPAVRVDPPWDICGAGDATNAGLTFAHVLGLSLEDAATVAGIVSSITIKQIGKTGTATLDEVLAKIS